MLAAIRAAGQELVAGGVNQSQALEQLTHQAPRWAAIGAEQARTIATRLQAAPS
jgi:hypothetical protein